MRFRDPRFNDASVARAIGVLKSKTGRDPSIDHQLPAVLYPVMRGAKNDQPVLVVISTLGTEHDVVDVDERGVTTSRNDTSSPVAPHHPATSGRRDVLMSTRRPHVGGGRRIDVTHLLSIASRHLDNFRPHFHLLGAPLLPSEPFWGTETPAWQSEFTAEFPWNR